MHGSSWWISLITSSTSETPRGNDGDAHRFLSAAWDVRHSQPPVQLSPKQPVGGGGSGGFMTSTRPSTSISGTEKSTMAADATSPTMTCHVKAGQDPRARAERSVSMTRTAMIDVVTQKVTTFSVVGVEQLPKKHAYAETLLPKRTPTPITTRTDAMPSSRLSPSLRWKSDDAPGSIASTFAVCPSCGNETAPRYRARAQALGEGQVGRVPVGPPIEFVRSEEIGSTSCSQAANWVRSAPSLSTGHDRP